MILDFDCLRLLYKLRDYDKEILACLANENLYTIHIPYETYLKCNTLEAFLRSQKGRYYDFPYFKTLIFGSNVRIASPHITMPCILIDGTDILTRAYALLQDRDDNECLCLVDKYDDGNVLLYTTSDAKIPKSWDIDTIQSLIDLRIAEFLQCIKDFNLKGERFIDAREEIVQFAHSGIKN